MVIKKYLSCFGNLTGLIALTYLKVYRYLDKDFGLKTCHKNYHLKI